MAATAVLPEGVKVRDGVVRLRGLRIGTVGGAPGGRWAATDFRGRFLGSGYWTRRDAVLALISRWEG